jgi:catechol 2,3-dioxygenase
MLPTTSQTLAQEAEARIDPATALGVVHLNVGDLARMVAYYQALGLTLLSESPQEVLLGAGESSLLALHARPGLAAKKEAGLFHFALLLPSRGDLSRVLRFLMSQELGFGGASDHAVSEALYLNDPEGNGIEIYRDRGREEWTYPGGTLRIITERLDFEGLLSESGEDARWEGFPRGTIMGHIHLQVADLPASELFYEQILGFERVSRYGRQATFISAGGYHHHLGMNTWGGPFPRRDGESLGLASYTITQPSQEALDQVAQRLRQADWPFEAAEEGIRVTDPSGIDILFTRLS